VQGDGQQSWRIQRRYYGWPGGFARLRLRRPGGELGDFTAPTKAMTRLVGSARVQNASLLRAGVLTLVVQLHQMLLQRRTQFGI